MPRRLCSLLALVVGVAAAPAADPAAAKITAKIDALLAADWAARGVQPAADADDAEFARRVHLDLIGRIPRVAEIRAFLADKDPDKRAKLVDRLMASPGFALHWAATLRADWVPTNTGDFRTAFAADRFENWLRKRLEENARLDALARRVVTAAVRVARRGQVEGVGDPDNQDVQNLAAYYEANEAKPEQLAASVSRVFLGVKLECAQCHDHPFAPYTREQFWQFAAFFGEFSPLPPVPPSFVGPTLPQYDVNTLTIPNTSTSVTARHFDGAEVTWKLERTPREELADWLTNGGRPYFSKNLANRVWAHFFGTGLIDPVDEPGDANPPSHPDVLQALADGLADSGYDLRTLIRAVTLSQAYQRTSKLSHPTQADPRRFARMAVKGLSGSQIYDSFLAATGSRDNAPRNQRFFNPGDDGGRNSFRTLFGPGTRPTDTRVSILQALMMMNGATVANQTSVGNSDTLLAVIDAPFLDVNAKIDALFLAAYTRLPTPEERERYASYAERGGPSGKTPEALADVFWVLLNGTEFLFNH